MFIFFISIFILIRRRRVINLVLGWDGLGVRSLLLIVFYPNKTSYYNSILTFFYNRLGDILLIFILGFIIFDPCFILFLWIENNFFLIILLLFCSFTKRAQFPLSSWLPAAISAPTPISAMVHSSTLVTAGLFIVCKSFYIINL